MINLNEETFKKSEEFNDRIKATKTWQCQLCPVILHGEEDEVKKHICPKKYLNYNQNQKEYVDEGEITQLLLFKHLKNEPVEEMVEEVRGF